MEVVGIFILIASVIGIGGIYTFIYSARYTPERHGHAEGFSGWLLFTAILISISPLFIIKETFDLYSYVGQVTSNIIYVLLLGYFLLLVLSIYVIILMVTKSRRFPMFAVVSWILKDIMTIILYLLTFILYIKYTEIPVDQIMVDVITEEDVIRVLLSVISTIILWIYLWQSKRVKNTFKR